MTYEIRQFGWLPDPPDFRDWKLRHPHVRTQLSTVVPRLSGGPAPAGHAAPGVGPLRSDLRAFCSPVEDQGPLGSCTAQATVGALEYFERRAKGVYVDASRRFLYKVTRRYLHWTGDSGAFVRSALKALRLFGACPEAYWPYDVANFDEEPQAFHYQFASNFKAMTYFRLPIKGDELRSTLDTNLPFIFGFTCFSSIRDPEVRRTGVIPYPGPQDSPVGGHAVLAVGYTDSHVLIRNSWGEGWGQAGYGFLPWTYFDESHPLADDCWALINASWVPPDDADADTDAGKRPRANGGRRRARPTNGNGAAIAGDVSPVIKAVHGTDPTRALPLRVTASGVRVADAPVALPQWDHASLFLKSLRLKQSFDWALFGEAVNELYFSAITWDLSGKPPVVYPPASIQEKALPMKRGDAEAFIGDGVQLWGGGPVVGGLYVRLLIMESDDEVRDFGKRMDEVRGAVANGKLAGALAVLAASVTTPVLDAVGIAANELAGVIANLLKANGDDTVALFEGTYGADRPVAAGTDSYDQRGAAIALELR
jgi:hypothetical protein